MNLISKSLFLARMVNDLSTLSRAERGIADETEIINITELAAQINSGIFATSRRERARILIRYWRTSRVGRKASRLYFKS